MIPQMANHVQRPKKKPPRSGLDDLRPKVSSSGFFTPRTLCFSLLFLVILYLISPGLRLPWIKFKEGDFPDKSILAEVKFDVIDLEATKLARDRAASLTPPVYILDQEAIQSSLAEAKEQFAKLEQDVLNPVFTREERIALISKYLPTTTSSETISFLADLDKEKFDKLRSATLESLGEVLAKGILSDVPGSAKEITIFDKVSRNRVSVKVDQAITLKKVPVVLEQIAAKRSPGSNRAQRVLRELISPFIRSTLSFEDKVTQLVQEENRKITPPVLKTFSKNQEIVQAGHRVSDQDLVELEAHELALSKANRLQIYIGNAILLLLVFGCFLFYLHRYRPEIARNNKALALIGFMAFITLLTGRVLLLLNLPNVWLFLVPVAAGGILLSTLVDDRLALIYAFFISILYAVQGGNRFDLFLVAALGSLAGVYYMRTIRKRSDIFWPGIVVSGVNAAAIISLNFIGIVGNEFISAITAGVLNGLITAIGVVPGSLIPLEAVFGIATNIRLLELSDLNHPLLKRLAMQAPGTYHHSLMVGNMAESAAEQINANSLLARVGSYYHDVGKMSKPLYFSENQQGGKNRHDDLTPTMSALILIAHVKEGVELAREHRLNLPIIELIKQHHGTSLMPYFYQKAMEQDPARSVDEENFRYPGPKPQTREAAICMLADSVEAAARTLVNPTHGRIKGLVEKIINNKFVDSQLDECDLTLKDLHKIADSFVRVLAGYLHSRVEYPEEQTIPEIKGKFESIDTKVAAKANHKNRAGSRSD
ncbi:MAG: HDIG domain-containing protein [Candidatus Abyssobacteria bacterium SURF_5]|uniref:HDIG domain-containing protein n=1 Tax=Abyssobacteria bacterium (strain SURF_5) TaxID=2093360 RepID=A0A3A4NQ13_ABYX5|nr:MAG: HDIG domain-containing protein [Candidatus Abyssubacteria bacterium SURF_5]